MNNIIWLIVLLFSLNACKTTKDKHDIVDVNSSVDSSIVIEKCLENGDCTLKVMKNSSMTIKEDTAGQMYPVIEKGDAIIIEYTFSKKGPEGTADGDYSETLHFSIPNNTKILYLEDASLQEVDLLFGKHCFCRGEAGFYKINKGELHIIKTSKELTIDVTYIVDETTQVTKHFTKTIKL